MEKLLIKCKIVTPLLMHGADGKTPELRAQSFKGVMRFWWRAIHGNLSLDELKEREAEIFGDTKRKSSFSIKVSNKKFSINSIKNNEKFYEQLENDGIKYNFYSLNINKEASLFESGSFDLDVNIFKEVYKKEIITTLNYINFFGNFGARSRRGAGSIKLSSGTLLEFEGNTKEELKDFFNKNFNKTIFSEYSTFAKGVYIFDPKNSWHDALEAIAYSYKSFREKYKADVFNTPNFGFPVRHRNGEVFIGKKLIRKENRNECHNINRRSSPLIFKIYEKDEQTYFPLIIHLGGRLLPQDYKIAKKQECNENMKLEEPSEEIIDEFFNSLEGNSYVKW